MCTVMIGIVIFIIYLTFYLCDVNRVQAQAQFIAKRAASGYGSCMNAKDATIDFTQWSQRGLLWGISADKSELEDSLCKEFKRNLKEALWFDADVDVSVSFSLSEVIITYSGTFKPPGAKKWFVGEVPFSGTCKQTLMDTPELIRLIGGVVRGFGD